MATWTRDDLDRIGAADELRLASRRGDGTLRKLVTMWVVRVGDDLYVRSVNGRDGAWFRGALGQHAGHIQAGGVEKDAAFVEEADSGLNDQIDEAYLAKYSYYPPGARRIVSPQARQATLRLEPR